MADLSIEQKCKLAVALVEQSPPGEVNDVINDIRAIINDDETLMPLIRPSLRAYNLAQLAVIEHPAEGDVPAHTSLLSESTIALGSSEERFVDSVAKRSFAFDHVTVAVTEYEPYELPEGEETFRAELAKSLATYAKNHFPSGTSSVSCSQFPLLPPAPPKPVPEPTAVEETTLAKDEPTTTEGGKDVKADVEPTDVETAAEDAKKEGVTEQTEEGKKEPVPTPLEEKEPEKEDETVAEPGGIEKLDEELKEEVKEAAVDDDKEAEGKPMAVEAVESSGDAGEKEAEAAAEQNPAEPKEESSSADAPGEVLVDAEKEVPAAAVEEAEPEPERKQERVENPTYTLEVVGNRYKPSNFWTGRWRTKWTVDQAKGSVDGIVLVDVHYYEQGNVQLTTKHSASFPCPKEANGSQSIASQIVTSISKIEAAYHMELNDVYEALGEKAFRALRRALPVTRQKMDWEKVSGYSLGADLSKARS